MVLIGLIQKLTDAIKDVLLKLFKWLLQILWKALLDLIKAIISFFRGLTF
jgi:hypothetical protein